MKIKLAILEKDRSYLARIVTAFSARYDDKLEIYSFTDPEVAIGTLSSARIDVLLASDAFDIDMRKLPNRCAFAYLVDNAGVEMLNNQQAIFKFQKADLIYKQILSSYSEKASSITGFKLDGDETRIIAFCAAGGGVGSSTMAAACAQHFAAAGSKVLYLNLEKFGSADLFFAGQGQFDMSDIIFALKSKKTNLPMKLESCVKQDVGGVHFYSQTKIALDMLELNSEDTLRLISELKLTGEYDYIVLDLDFAMDKETLKIYRQAQALVMVGDGSAESNAKTVRAYTALETLEMSSDAPLTNRTVFLHNKVSSQNSTALEAAGLRVLGGAPRYSGASARQIVNQLAAMDVFDGIL